MPANVTDHDKWERAKKLAAEQGRAKDWAYVSGIYQRMGGQYAKGKAYAEAMDEIEIDDGLNKSSWPRFHMRANAPGQIPGKTVPQSLTNPPVIQPSQALDVRMMFLDPVHRPERVTAGLLDGPDAREFQRFVDDQLRTAGNEAVLRVKLSQHMMYDRKDDPALRRALMQRALSYYRTKGVSQDRAALNEARRQGLRKSEDVDGTLPTPIRYVMAHDTDLEKANYPVGTIRTWKDGKRYQKMINGRWVPIAAGSNPILKRANAHDKAAKKLRAEADEQPDDTSSGIHTADHYHDEADEHHQEAMRLRAAAADGRTEDNATPPHLRSSLKEWADHHVDTTDRMSNEEAIAKLREMGSALYMLQAQDSRARDDSGFSLMDMKAWGNVDEDNPMSMRRVLKKYRRQITENFGPNAYAEAGLADPIPAKSVQPKYDDNGWLSLPVDGWLGKELFPRYREINKKHNVRYIDGRNVVRRQDHERFDLEAYREDMRQALDVEVLAPRGNPPQLTPQERAGDALRDQPLDVDTAMARLRRRDLDNTIVVKRYDDGGFAFHSTFSREFNDVLSNKKGNISGITEYRANQNHGRFTYDLDLVEEILEKLKDRLPDFTYVVDPKIEDAIKERERYHAELQQPIPEVQAKLAPDFKLFPYQNEAVRFLDQTDGKAIIGDEMGLGKTLQSLAWLAKNNKRALVVVPKVVRRTWIEEADKFFPGHFNGVELDSKMLRPKKLTKAETARLAAAEKAYQEHSAREQGPLAFLNFEATVANASPDQLVATGMSAADAREAIDLAKRQRAIDEGKSLQPDLSKVNIVTINYESLEKFRPAIEAAGFDTIIMDESHRMKNPKAKVTQSIQSIAEGMPHRILLSGTAVKNKKEELHTQVELISPGLLGTREQLRRATIGGTWNKMRDVYIARQKREVLPDLPEKSTTVARLAVKDAPDIGDGPIDLAAFTRTRSALAQAKVPATIDMVKEILASSDSSVLVFSETVEGAKRIAEGLGDKALLHHGQMSHDKREAAKGEFQREGSPKRVFVSTRPSLAVGATLTAADKVVFNDLPWTAADVRQAEDRAHRVGQRNNVNVYWVTAQDNALDEAIAEIVQRKYVLSKKVNEGKQISPEERAWMEQSVAVEDILAAVKGKGTGPKAAAPPKAPPKKTAVKAPPKPAKKEPAVAKEPPKAEPSGQLTMFKADLEKAQTRGGSYHRRVTDPKTGKHRYYYDADKYQERDDAHVSGEEAKKRACRDAIDAHLGEDGKDLASLKELAKRYDTKMISDVVREMHGKGRYRFDKGKLSRRLEKAERFLLTES